MAANPVFPIPELTIDRQIFEQQRSNDSVTLFCHGRLVASTVPFVQHEVRGLIPKAKTIVLDLTEVRHMDSSGIGALVGLYVSAKRAGKRLRLIHLNERVRELLEDTKLLDVFEVSEYL